MQNPCDRGAIPREGIFRREENFIKKLLIIYLLRDDEKMRIPKLFLIAFVLMFFIHFVLATSITSCSDSVTTGENILANNINSSGTCLNIIASHTVLDCSGYTINYSHQSEGGSPGSSYYGVKMDIGGTLTNVTIKNCNFIQDNSSAVGSSIYAIYLSSVSSVSIINNTGDLKGGGAIKISSVPNSNITSNNFSIWSLANGLSSSDSNNTLINNNTFLVNGSGESDGRGIAISSGYLNTIENNVITHNANSSGEGRQGIRLSGSNHIIRNNNITTANVVGLKSAGVNNTIVGNVINSGGDALDIDIDSQNSLTTQFNSTVENNTIFGKPILYYANLNSLSIANNNSIGQLLIYNTNNVYLSNLTMITRGLSLVADGNVTLVNSTFTSNISAVYAYNSTNLTINNNNFTRYNDNRTGGEAYLYLYGVRYSNITSNNIETFNDGTGGMMEECVGAINLMSIDTMGPSDTYSNNVILNNITTWGIISCGLQLKGAFNNTIRSNIIVGNSNKSIGIDVRFMTSTENNIFNNRVTMKAGDTTSYVVQFNSMGPPSNNTFYNNLFNISSSINNGSGVNIQPGMGAI